MLSNQTCYWGVCAPPLREKQGEWKTEGAACWGGRCFHVRVMFGKCAAQRGYKRRHVDSPVSIHETHTL